MLVVQIVEQTLDGTIVLVDGACRARANVAFYHLVVEHLHWDLLVVVDSNLHDSHTLVEVYHNLVVEPLDSNKVANTQVLVVVEYHLEEDRAFQEEEDH